MMPCEEKKHFFISYSHHDEEQAVQVATIIEEAGYSLIIQKWHFSRPGGWVGMIQNAHLDTDRTICIFSPHYFESDICKAEWTVRYQDDPNGDKGLLIPIIIEPCDIKGLPSIHNHVDITDMDWELAKAKILNMVKAIPPKISSFLGKSKQHALQPDIRGSLPAIFNVPQKNRNFSGRKAVLKNLHKALKTGKGVAVTQAISGLGGVGKTQLAIEYAYRHRGDYLIIWWVHSEEPVQLAFDYAALAKELNLPQRDSQKQEEIIAAVKHWLEHNDGWLLIFDNARTPDDLIRFLPRGETGCVIITSRYSIWSEVACDLPLDVMESDEAVEFLLDKTGQDDEKSAKKLAKELGYLPLALEHARAYICELGIPIREYLNLYKQYHIEILKRSKAPIGYKGTVDTTWKISFDKVKNESKEAGDLLNLFAFLAPDNIPLGILTEGVEYLPKSLSKTVSDPLELNSALQSILKYSLIKLHKDLVSIHRLVRAVIRSRLDKKGAKKWAKAAVEIVNYSFPENPQDLENWPDCERLLPHALIAAEHSQKFEMAPESTGRLLNETGLYLQERGEFGEAKTAVERALAIYEATYGPDHADVAAMLSNLGLILKDLGELENARKLMERALAIDEATYGPDHPDVAILLSNFGPILQDLGQLESARELMERALAIDEATYGLDHPHVAITLSNLGLILQDLRQLENARKLMEHALTIDEATYGPDHPKVAITLSNLGLILQDLGEFESARKLMERSLAIDEATYGPDHPYVATMLSNLGLILRVLCESEDARKLTERALVIDEATYGSDHPNVAIDLNNFGMILQDLGELENARKLMKRALAICIKSLGEDHPKTKLVRDNLNSLGS